MCRESTEDIKVIQVGDYGLEQGSGKKERTAGPKVCRR